MKQLDYESSNYKHKEDIKLFVNSFNELADKYVKNFENSDADLKKVNSNIEKKTAAIEKLDANLLDLNNKTSELAALKELSNEEIKDLNVKKSSISYTDSEVQKMELDDINSQITAKKGKISKIDTKIDATKQKIKASSDEKKASQKELQELEKARYAEEEALFRTQSLVALVQEIKDEMNTRALDIVNAPYTKERTDVPIENESQNALDFVDVLDKVVEEETVGLSEITEEELDQPISEGEVESTSFGLPKIDEEDISIMDYDIDSVEIEGNEELEHRDDESEHRVEEAEETDDEDGDSDLVLGSVETTASETKEMFDPLLEDLFRKEGVDVHKFSDFAKDKMLNNRDSVIKNIDILKKHEVPLEYTLDQPEIFYDISSQDLDDLLSIITTDDEGNGMGFTIDFTFNILTELSKINVDKLIDVYNSEFMNVSAKSGIIYLLKLTNPSLTDFEKNRNANIKILRDLGANTVDEIVEKHPEFVDMDNPLFVSVLNVFDRSDLVEKLNSDVDVVTKIIDYWKNN